jgi:predicted ATP-grasp superfamily ATP-dependent carboligase
MRALLAEYARSSDPLLAPEGEAMFRVLERSFRAIGYEVVSPGDGDFGADTGNRVIKPVNGCGSRGVVLADRDPGPGEIAERYIPGDNLSVSLVGSRVIGDACEYYSGAQPLLLSINRQFIEIAGDGSFHYHGGETPVSHPRGDEIFATASKATTVLGCQGYTGVDVVVADRVYVVDVNPRITTSITGIAACMEEEIAAVLIAASKGAGPDRVTMTGRVRYDHTGRVEPA